MKNVKKNLSSEKLFFDKSVKHNFEIQIKKVEIDSLLKQAVRDIVQ